MYFAACLTSRTICGRRLEPKTVTLLRSNNIRDGRLNFHDVQYVEAHTVRPEQHLKHSDIAVCMSNGNRALVGKAGQFDEPSINTAYTVGAFCSIFRPTADYESDFVRYQFSSPLYQQQLDSLLAGSAISNLKGSDVAALKALVPTCWHEQSKIAEVLSTVDRAIEQTEALIAKQQRIKTGLMQDLLTRGIDEHGNLRSEQTHAFKDSPLGRIPVEWECASFGDCWGASAQNGLYKPQSQYSDDGTPIIRIDGFRNGDLIDHQTFRRVRLAPAESRTFALEAGDLLVNRVNSIEWLGKAALVGSLTEATVFESNMMRIRVEQQWLISEFAILVLSSPHAYHHFRLCAKTAIAQASINQEDARSLLVALPHRVEQHRIVDAVQAAHRADGRLKGATLKLRLLRTGLMQDLLTGNRRVTPLLEECDRDTP